MKTSVAKLNYLKMAPRKVRLVADSIKKMPIQEAEAQLLVRPQRAAGPILKLLRSAIANSKNKELDQEKLFISNIRVDNGPMLKRILPRAMGRATLIQKKSSHITLVLEERKNKFSQRFNIEVEKKGEKEKAKKEEKDAKQPPMKKPERPKRPEIPQEKGKEKSGFLKRIFKRKSV